MYQTTQEFHGLRVRSGTFFS